MSTVADDLRAAASYIREHGWTTGTAGRVDGSVCALGSMSRVAGMEPAEACYEPPDHLVGVYGHDKTERYVRMTAAMRNWLADALPNGSIAQWNDTPGRTAEDVTAELEKAAAWTEEQV